MIVFKSDGPPDFKVADLSLADFGRDEIRLAFAQLGIDLILQANQDDIDVFATLQEIKRSGDSDLGAVISPHAVDGDRYVHQTSSLTRTVHSGARVATLTSTTSPIPTRLWF